jgi:pyrroloquinoline quinone biosynthesis protein E
VCRYSPQHGEVLAAVARAEAAVQGATEHPLVFRDPANSRRLGAARAADAA